MKGNTVLKYLHKFISMPSEHVNETRNTWVQCHRMCYVKSCVFLCHLIQDREFDNHMSCVKSGQAPETACTKTDDIENKNVRGKK